MDRKIPDDYHDGIYAEDLLDPEDEQMISLAAGQRNPRIKDLLREARARVFKRKETDKEESSL